MRPAPPPPDEPTGPGARVDPLTGRTTWVVPGRQDRPNLPLDACPFCPGGLEHGATEDGVGAFPNRWPPFPDGRAEVVLYTGRHEATFAELTPGEARRVVDLWAERSSALGADPDVAYVLVFENRGAEVGATIAHPHGQIYAFPEVPPAAAVELEGERSAEGLGPEAAGGRLVATAGPWRAWVPVAASWPYELVGAPEPPVPDLPALDDAGRDGLGALLVDLSGRLDRLFDAPMPLMLWFHQRPFDGSPWPQARLHLHVAPLLRAPGVPRFVAAGELGSGVWFDPVDPATAADRLRRA